MNEYIPFTYRIGWSKLRLYYYGAKYAKGCNPTMLWQSYFTSSETVKTTRLLHGEPDIIEIRRTFDNKEKCLKWEQRILKLICESPKYLNHRRSANLGKVSTTEGMVAARDRLGNTLQVKVGDCRFLTGEIQHVTKGKVTVVDNYGNLINISVNDSRYISGEFKFFHEVRRHSDGFVCAYDSNNKIIRVTKDEFESRTDLRGNRKNRVKLKNIHTKECVDIDKSKMHRYNTSEWIPSVAKKLYHTPMGTFTSLAKMPDTLKSLYGNSIIPWCKNPDKVITIKSINGSKHLKDKSLVGKMPRELGFWSEDIE